MGVQFVPPTRPIPPRPEPMTPHRRRIAVVGSGVAGLTAAWLLAERHDVTLWESASRLGGHSNTVDVETASGPVAVDTGFIVFNRCNYPNLTALLDHLGVPSEASEMSFSVSVGDGRFEYAGAPRGRGLLAQPSNLVNPAFWRMMADIRRFFADHADPARFPLLDGKTLGDILAEGGYGETFVRAHLLPMAAAIWSGPADGMLDFPARSFLQFFANHGLLRFRDRPQWRTVTGGSRRYVEKMAARLVGSIRLGAPVEGIARRPEGVLVRAGGETHVYDDVVIAAHADQAARMLDDPSRDEAAVLGGFSYAKNRAVLHEDPRLMPRRRRAWASWNYIARTDDDLVGPTSVTYWMNRLQNLESAPPLFVSLNPLREPDRVRAAFEYDHPQFDAGAVAAQNWLEAIQGVRRTWFCGSYFGHGFHEDALTSGLRVAEALGETAPWAAPVPAVQAPAPRQMAA